MKCGLRITLLALATTIGCRGEFYPSDDMTDSGLESGTEDEASSGDEDSSSATGDDTTHGADDGDSSGEETTEDPATTEGGTTEDETTDTSDSNTDAPTETGSDTPTEDPTTGTEDPTTGDTTDSTSAGPLGPDQPCHPLWEDAGTPPCGNALTCTYMGWDPDYDSYQWLCQIYTGDDPGGEFGDPTQGNSGCKTGASLASGGFPDGVCNANLCCTEHCDVQNDLCPPDMHCMPSANQPDQYPEQIQNSSIPLVGYCFRD